MLNTISHRLPPYRGVVNFIWAQLYTVVNNTWLHNDLMIIGKSDKERRRVGWNDDLFPKSTVDRSSEMRTTLRIVLKCHTNGDSAASGEAHHANPVRGDTPLRSMLPYHFHGLLSVSNR